MPKRDVVEWADSEVSIFDVLRDFFGIHHPRTGSSFKGWCPFRWEHPDQTDKGFRTYPDTNSAYCFVMHGSLTPVRLLVVQREWGYRRAAQFLLDHYGISRRPWRERWVELQAERSRPPGIGDPQEMIAALHDSIQLHPNYPPGGFSKKLSRAMEWELDILDKLLAEGADRPIVEAWFRRAKQRLEAELDDKEVEVG